MGADQIEGGFDMTRPMAMDAAIRAARDDAARLNLASFALDQPDSREWLAYMVDVLGLRGKSRPAKRPRSTTRDVRRGKGELVHGTPNGYDQHKCRCDLCRDANRRQRQAKGITK